MALFNFTPEGANDLNGLDCENKESMQLIVKDTFKKYGYQQISTSVFEYYDLFLDIETSIDKDQMYKIIDSNGKILVLRPDATIPIARMAAQLEPEADGQDDRTEPYKKYMYVTQIFRNEDLKVGGKRGFTQAGVEYLGNANPEADAEVIALAINTLLAIGFWDIRVDLGSGDFLNGILSEMNLNEDQESAIASLLENKNFAELEKFLDANQIGGNQKEALLALPFLYGDFTNTIQEAKKIVLNEKMQKCLDNLCEIYRLLEYYGLTKFVFADMGFVSHLKYYSGVIFKVYLGNTGSAVASGGRYDSLLQEFGKQISATGFGMNIDTVYEAACKVNYNYLVKNYLDYAIVCSQQDIDRAINLAKKLRDLNYSVILCADRYVDVLARKIIDSEGVLLKSNDEEINNDQYRFGKR